MNCCKMEETPTKPPVLYLIGMLVLWSGGGAVVEVLRHGVPKPLELHTGDTSPKPNRPPL